jgi:hypothetical protein
VNTFVEVFARCHIVEAAIPENCAYAGCQNDAESYVLDEDVDMPADTAPTRALRRVTGPNMVVSEGKGSTKGTQEKCGKRRRRWNTFYPGLYKALRPCYPVPVSKTDRPPERAKRLLSRRPRNIHNPQYHNPDHTAGVVDGRCVTRI